MRGNWKIARFAILLATSALLSWLGICIPVHFRAIAPELLARAADEGDTPADLASDYVSSGKVGPIRLLWESRIASPAGPDRQKIADLVAKNPLLQITGGPAPVFASILVDAQVRADPSQHRNLGGVMVLRSVREAALARLASSGNATVQAILRARDIREWKVLPALDSEAGAPLDSAVLTLALLAESDSLRPVFARSLPSMVDGAASGDGMDLMRLENTLLATISLSRRMDWTELSEFVRRVDSPEDLADAASRTASTPSDLPVYFVATVFSGNYATISKYVSALPPGDGIEALRLAVRRGAGALAVLTAHGEGLYTPPRLMRFFDRHLSILRPDAFAGPALHHRSAALVIKIAIIYASGYLLTLAVIQAWFGLCRVPGDLSHCRRCLILSGNVFAAGAFTIVLWMFLEPNLLRFTTERPARAVFDLGHAFANKTPIAQAMNANPLDQASVLSLLLFFMVQLSIYVFCVMRLARIRATPLPPTTRLKLLENEENLFDLGLYIGLFGTIGSLLMLSMNIIQASLVAAYSSTLFGILFTAVFKIVHIRTFRRNLIMEIENGRQPELPAEATERR
ncbi:MAG TPA: hypothetical protein PKI32_06725 [Opitutales bacterium]|nr:hypothetical protein [Opitutales bacterium]